MRVEAGTREQSLGEGRAWVQAAPLENELYDAQLRRESLERLATETGGRYYDRDSARARGRRSRLQPRGLDAARAPRPVGHADRLPRAGGAAGAGVGAAAPLGDGLRWRALARSPAARCARSRDARRLAAPAARHASARDQRPRRRGELLDVVSRLVDLADRRARSPPACRRRTSPTWPRIRRATPSASTATRARRRSRPPCSRWAPAPARGGELWIVIFGHGSARGDEATINLPGPDLSGGELGRDARAAAGRSGS